MNLQRNYYEVLGVGPDATSQEIKNKYRELARKFHPDLVKDKVLGVKVFSQVNKAYHVLGDPQLRREYDEQQLGDKTRARNGSGSINNDVKPPVAAPPPVVRTLSASQMAQLERSLNLADSAIMEGSFDQARQLCEKILEIDSRNARALGILGDAYSSLHRNESAIKAYKKTMETSPSSMIEAKLRRLEQAAAQTTTERPAVRQNGSGPAETKPSGGLFSKLMGRK